MKHRKDNSTKSQQSRLLAHLRRGERLTTCFCREELGVMSVSARIGELRKQGHKIIVYKDDAVDVAGVRHQDVAHYVLMSG